MIEQKINNTTSDSTASPNLNNENQKPGFIISLTIKEVQKYLKDKEPVSAASFAREILNIHSSDYADGKAASISIEDTAKKLKTQEWLKEIQLLYDPLKITTITNSDITPELNGRLVILGLCLLEPELRRQLIDNNIFRSLKEELRYPFQKILTDRGRELYVPPDSVPNQSDHPLKRPEDDLLGRAAFARYLAKRITAVSPESGAYSFHLYGSWGSGKSTVLNFLGKILKDDYGWEVVEFNAWRHQHLNPPWWQLMKSVYQKIKAGFNPWERFCEYWWRFTTGRSHYLLGIIILIIVTWAFSLYVFPFFTSSSNSLSDTAQVADNIAKILAVFVTLWGIIKAFTRSLLNGSAQDARNYVQLTNDPMNSIKKRFTTLIKRINPKRLAIFIDDLDRCRESYVVEFLEGIQTLFREAPVVFVVAADRNWLNACYSVVYESLKPWVREPGKPMGMLFLEKAFQFSTPMPGMPEDLKKKYWQDLIKIKQEAIDLKLNEARIKAKQLLDEAKTEDEVIHAVSESLESEFFERRAIREEAVVRLASPEVVERTEHALKPLVSSLGVNPRAMKRLVNAYSVNRALAILSENEIDRAQLALWTILSLRWPLLSEYLEKFPEKIRLIGESNKVLDVTEELQQLFNDPEVELVVQGGGTQNPLDVETVQNCALLRG